MCGRFTLRTSGKAVADFFGLREIPELPPRFNIAPTQPVPVVRVSTEHADRGAGAALPGPNPLHRAARIRSEDFCDTRLRGH
jgi:putative SOS response-associated peptidase YedK